MSKIILLFVATFAGGAVLAFVYGAHLSFYLYEIVYFLNPKGRWWGASVPDLPYSLITVTILLFLTTIGFSKYRTNRIVDIPYVKALGLFIASYLVAYSYALSPERHYVALVDFMKLFVVMGVAYKVLDSQKKLEGALGTYLVAATYIGYEAFVVGRNEFGRVEGIGMVDVPDANGTAAAIVAALPLLIFYFWKGHWAVKIATVLMGAMIVNCLVLINSRGAVVGGGVACVYMVWEMYRAKISTPRQRVVVLGMVACGILAVASLIDESFITRVDTITAIEDEATSGSHRYRFWLAAIEMSKTYPQGTGAFGYQLLSPQFLPPELFDKAENVRAVHSIWFQALSEVGWHGFLLFLWIIWSVYRLGIKARQHCRERGDHYGYYLVNALIAGFLGLLAASSFINQFRSQLIYWMILFLTCAYSVFCTNVNSTQPAPEKAGRSRNSRVTPVSARRHAPR